MKQFKTDAPEFFRFQLDDSGVTYEIPLAASMPSKVILSVNGSIDTQIAMLRKYMGDIVDDLPLSTASEILKAWSEASRDMGASVGESKALSD